jgi:protease IV
MKFLVNVLATIVGLLIFFFLISFFFVGIIASASSEQQATLKDNSVLKLSFDRPVVERTRDNPFGNIPALQGISPNNIGLLNFKEAIRQASEEPKIKGIMLDAAFSTAGPAASEEIRDVLKEFKQTGKFIYAHGDLITENAYLVASVADSIFINPDFTSMEFNGLTSEVTFIKKTLDKLGVEPQIFRVGEYKSAAEPFIREDLSEENKEQISEYLNSIYDYYLNMVSESRGIDVDSLRYLSDNMIVNNQVEALEYGLVDGLAYYSDVLQTIQNRLGINSVEDINFLSYDKYQRTIKADFNGADSKVAVVVANGNIGFGKGDGINGGVGSETFTRSIREARLDEKVEAIVMRINSPGGVAIAGDAIWNEIQLAAKEKPVIASMGDVAASGGYQLAMSCDTIVAHPNTITGSIGIILVTFNAEKFLEDKIGVTTERITTGKYSDINRLTSSLNEEERAIIQESLDNGYADFTQKAAEGRNMPIEELEKLAGGRVYSGRDAQDINLVDLLGGLDDAVGIAAEKAGLDEGGYSIEYLPKKKTFIEELFEDLETSAVTRFKKSMFGEYYPYIEKAAYLKEMKGVQARMPYDLKIY